MATSSVAVVTGWIRQDWAGGNASLIGTEKPGVS